MIKDEPEIFAQPRGWTMELYLWEWQKCKGLCQSCGCDLALWQKSGHRLDRIDNNIIHYPDNCRLVCWPCNLFKRNLHPSASQMLIRALLAEHAGKIPWAAIFSSGIQRAELPAIDHLRRENPQGKLFAA